MASQNGTQAIDRAAALLTHVIDGQDAVSFAELTAASGLAKSTTSRLLTALERHHLIRRDGDGQYWPGEVFVRYAWRGTSGTDLVAVAQPYLEKLGDLTGETINLGIVTAADGGRGVAEPIAQVESRYLLGATNWVGLTVPLHCSALGKVLVAFGAAEIPPGPLERLTDRTIVSRAALSAELATVRERGYAVSDEELEPALIAIAAPVFAGGDTAIAALSVSGPSPRLTPDQIPVTGRICARIAGQLSAALTGLSGPRAGRNGPAC